jgi:hypothetical protein
MSIPFIPSQEFKKFNFKVKIKKKKRRSGNRGRRKKKKKKDSYSEELTGTSTTSDDVFMFTRIVQWICSLFTWKTLRPQTEGLHWKDVKMATGVGIVGHEKEIIQETSSCDTSFACEVTSSMIFSEYQPSMIDDGT